jgi:hypothetical protein
MDLLRCLWALRWIVLALGCLWTASDCRVLAPGHGRLACVCQILTSCSELSHRAVRSAFALHSADRKPSPLPAVTHSSRQIPSVPPTLSTLSYHHHRFPPHPAKRFGLGDSLPGRRGARHAYHPERGRGHSAGDFIRKRVETSYRTSVELLDLGPRDWLDDIPSFLCCSPHDAPSWRAKRKCWSAKTIPNGFARYVLYHPDCPFQSAIMLTPGEQ